MNPRPPWNPSGTDDLVGRPRPCRLSPDALQRLAEIVETTELEGVYEEVFDTRALS